MIKIPQKIGIFEYKRIIFSLIPPGLEDLPPEERERILSVMAQAEMDTATTPLAQTPNPFASVQPSVSSTPPSVTPSKRPTVQAPPIPQTRRLSDGISDLSSGTLFRNTNLIYSVESYEILVRFSSRLEMKLTSDLNN